MPTTSGSLLGNYAPAMQEPYAIETNLADRATGGSSALANTMLNQYWYERQMREGQYADRLNDQMQFGKQQLHAQLMDTYLKSMPDLAKANLLPAVGGILQSQVPGLDAGGLQYAADQAAQTTQATNVGNAGRGIGAMAQGGYNVGAPDVSRILGGANVTQTDPALVRAAQIRAAGQVAAANARGGGGTTYTTTYAPADDDSVTVVKGRTPPPGFTSLPPAGGGGGGGGGGPPPNRPTATPAGMKPASDDVKALAAAAIEATKTSPHYRNAVGGYVGNKPNAFTDNSGNVFVRGKDGAMIPLGHPGNQQ